MYTTCVKNITIKDKTQFIIKNLTVNLLPQANHMYNRHLKTYNEMVGQLKRHSTDSYKFCFDFLDS